MQVSCGKPLLRLIRLAYLAGTPLLLIGKHGIGKTEILAQAANSMGIGLIVRDLSLMEPPDLIGLPTMADGRTRYCPPEFLPEGGCGMLVLEEINRCPHYMQAPCLQLLTARRLNDYPLPGGWLPCAAINSPEDGDYVTEAMDEALSSRFLRVRVVPEVTEWLNWSDANFIHPSVREFVGANQRIFDDPEANPRAWKYVNDVLKAWESLEAKEQDPETLNVAVAGFVGDKWASAFTQVYSSHRLPLNPGDILQHYPGLRRNLIHWRELGQLDTISATIELLKREMAESSPDDPRFQTPALKRNLRSFLSDLPADLKLQATEWFNTHGFAAFTVPPHDRRVKS